MASDPLRLSKQSNRTGSRRDGRWLFVVTSLISGGLSLAICLVLLEAFQDFMGTPVFGHDPNYSPTFQHPSQVMCYCLPLGVAFGVLR